MVRGECARQPLPREPPVQRLLHARALRLITRTLTYSTHTRSHLTHARTDTCTRLNASLFAQMRAQTNAQARKCVTEPAISISCFGLAIRRRSLTRGRAEVDQLLAGGTRREYSTGVLAGSTHRRTRWGYSQRVCTPKCSVAQVLTELPTADGPVPEQFLPRLLKLVRACETNTHSAQQTHKHTAAACETNAHAHSVCVRNKVRNKHTVTCTRRRRPNDGQRR